MKIIITAVLMSISFKGVCSEFDTLSSFFSRLETVSKFQESLTGPIHNLSLKKKREILNRELDFGLKQSVYDLDMNEYGPNNFRVYLISINDSIILGCIEELDWVHDTLIKRDIFKEIKERITPVLDQHYTFYEKKYSSKEFIVEMTETITFGFYCGRSRGYFPPEAIAMLNYVSNNDYGKLSEMMRSINPELQAYGVTGVEQLEKKGVEIKINDVNIINHLKKRNIKIHTCYGCVFGRTQDLIHVLKWYDEMPEASNHVKENLKKEGIIVK